jgi:hypothetical protein
MASTEGIRTDETKKLALGPELEVFDFISEIKDIIQHFNSTSTSPKLVNV